MRILLVRIAAFGDVIVTTPLVRYLKNRGDEIYYLASEQAEQILKNNPNIDKIIPHKRDSIPSDMLGEYFNSVAQAHECDAVIDLCESIEVNLSLHPSRPYFKYTKPEKYAKFNRNFYEEMFHKGRVSFDKDCNLLPEFFPRDEERDEISRFFSPHIGKFKIIWGLSGSSRNKIYPYTDSVINEFLRKHDDSIFILVGDESCAILEFNWRGNERVIPMSGIWDMRHSITAISQADLLISPDTGLLHGSGCWDTPKIGLLNATTKEQVTKHFKNDFSIEAESVACAPCFHIIYDADTQCSLRGQRAPICMWDGIKPERLMDQMEAVYTAWKVNALSTV